MNFKVAFTYMMLILVAAGCSRRVGQSSEQVDMLDKPQILHAAETGDLEGVIDILKKDRTQVRAILEPGSPDTPLHLAAWQGHRNIAAVLLSYGADINARGDCGMTPLHYAVQGRYSELVQLLIESGADLNAKDDYGVTYLDQLAQDNDPHALEIIRLLLDNGATVDLHAAMGLGMIEKIRTILRDNPEVVQCDPKARYFIPEAIALIYQKTSDVAIKSHHPTQEEASRIKKTVAEVIDILDTLITLKAPKSRCYPALHVAVQMPDITVAKRLLDYGMPTTSDERFVEDLYDAAQRSPCKDEMTVLLLQYGVRRKHQDTSQAPLDLTNLQTQLKNEDPRLRWMAATFLGDYGPRAKLAIPALREALKDPDQRVVSAAAAALKKIDPEAALQAGIPEKPL